VHFEFAAAVRQVDQAVGVITRPRRERDPSGSEALLPGRLVRAGGMWAVTVKAASEQLGYLVIGGVEELDDPDRRTIERAGVVTLVVQREEPPYQYVVVEGTVVDTATPAPLEVREAVAIRYLGEEGGRAFVQGMADRPGILFTIRPDRWITADFTGEL